jgi:hypothetical protein
MEKDYAKAFNKKGHVLMTTTNFKPINVKRFDGKFIISFLGNVDFNRSKVLIEVGQVVKKLNSEGYNIEFSIYSGETDKERTKEFTLENGIHFKGKVNYDQVCEAISKSNLLLHVESFDEINRTKTKYSISTKVPDSLASGRCLFAYGPPEVASIKYLKDNDCAYVVTEPNNLERGLRNIVENECLRNQYISKAKQVAKENHNLFKNTMKFKRLLQTAVCKGVQCSLR